MSSRDHAIVIGVNNYKLPGHELTAPVADALRFAQWVTQPESGRVERKKESLTLLLAPGPKDELGELEELAEAATGASIRKALLKYSLEGADLPDRLWLFYAGHAFSPNGSTSDQGPNLLPPDCENLEAEKAYPTLSFELFRRALLSRGPAEQIMFIDACRSLSVSKSGLYGEPLLHDANAEVKNNLQAILFGTTSRSDAHENGHGLFSQAVLKGLRGRAPLKFDIEDEDYKLMFSSLSEYVIDEVARLLKNLRQKLIQVPHPVNTPKLSIARFPERPTASLTLQLRPAEALEEAKVRLRISEFEIKEIERSVPDTISWTIPLGEVAYSVESPGYKRAREKLEVYEDARRAVVLKRDVLENYVPPLQVLTPGPAKLILSTHDHHVHFVVVNNDGNIVARGPGELETILDIPAGGYSVEWLLPGQGPVGRERVEVSAEKTVAVRHRPDTELSDLVENDLRAVNIRVEDGFVYPSEVFEGTTLQRLGSLLSWAATAALFSDGAAEHLRALGVLRVDSTADQSWVQVLIGDVELNPNIEIQFGEAGAERVLDATPVPGLARFAKQARAEIPVGGGSLRLSSSALDLEIALPLPFAPGWISVVVVSRESDGTVDVHRYFHEATPTHRFSDHVRVREQHWRALEQRAPIAPEEVTEILENSFTDPLTAIIVGYRLAQAGRLAEWKVDRKFVSVVPDAHVLDAIAAGSDVGRVDAAMHRLAGAIPLVGSGFAYYHAWLERRARENGLPPPIPLRAAIHGALWTSFDAREGSARVATAQAIPASVLDSQPLPWVRRIRPIVDSTLRIEINHSKIGAVSGTAIRIGPSMLLTVRFILGDEAREITTTLGEERLALVQYAEQAPETFTPLELSMSPPYVGQRIAVIGFPAKSLLPAEAINKAFAETPMGEKYVLPGEITTVEPSMIEYAAFTLGGTAGGPVVDLDTGRVIAIHFAGRYDRATGVKYGSAVPLSWFAGEAFWNTPGLEAKLIT